MTLGGLPPPCPPCPPVPPKGSVPPLAGPSLCSDQPGRLRRRLVGHFLADSK